MNLTPLNLPLTRETLKNKNSHFGFTLIELIVVVTIIALITAIGTISYSATTKKSRDGRRMADLEKYRVALEMAKQIGTTYPGNVDVLVTMNLLNATLSDPKSGYSYVYTPAAGGYSYTLYAQMEDTGSKNMTNISGCGDVCNYKVTSP